MKKLLPVSACCFCLILLINLVCFATDPTARMDFDGDGITDVGVFDNAPHVLPEQPTYFRYISSITNQVVSIQWGETLDMPAQADYDGDGKTDVAIYRIFTQFVPPHYWINGTQTGISVRQWGPAVYDAFSVPRDYDGDGKANLALASSHCDFGDPKTSADDFCQNLYSYQLANNGGTNYQLIGYRYGNTSVGGGFSAPGDYDGAGRSIIAIYDPWADKFRVFTPPYSSSDIDNVMMEQSMDIDIPTPGDFNGDGRTDFAGVKNFQSQSLTPMIWKIKYNLRNQSSVVFEIVWGMSNEYPVPGDYDGDSRTDIAVYNKQTSTWTIRRSSDLSTMTRIFGDSNDTPTTFPFQTTYYFNPFPSSPNYLLF